MKANTVELGLYTLKSLPKGEFVKLKADSNAVYIKGDWDRATKRFELTKADDVNKAVYKKSDCVVQAGFTY